MWLKHFNVHKLYRNCLVVVPVLWWWWWWWWWWCRYAAHVLHNRK